MSIKYRPEINGLRAVAVVPVVLFHADIPGFSGGYIGVDVFFVISGYLITSVILSDLSANSFSLRAFYERRARRILPALLVVLSASLLLAWWCLDPDAMSEFGRSLTGAALFSANHVFWGERGYFDTSSQLKPLVHTWSLSLEEQFYLLFPAAMIFAWRLRRVSLSTLLAVAAVLSFILAEYCNRWHPDAGFFWLPPRAWELLIGGWLASRELTNPLPMPTTKVASGLAMAGLILIVGAIMSLSDTALGPVQIMVPVLGAALLLAHGAQRGLVHSVLSWRPVVGLGLISYSLYLWHHVLFAFARISVPRELRLTDYWFLIVASIALAWLTYRFIERPFRHRSDQPSRIRILPVAMVGTAAVAGVGSLLVLSGAPWRFSPQEQSILSAPQATARTFTQQGRSCLTRATADACLLGSFTATPTWALVGDSHAGALGRTLSPLLMDRRLAGRQLTHAGCRYVVELPRPKYLGCGSWNIDVRALLRESDLTDIVIAGRYVYEFERTRFDNGEGGKEPTRPASFFEGDRRVLFSAYQKSVRELIEAGKRVYLVYPIPEVGWNVPRELFKLRAIWRRDDELTTDYRRYLARTARVREAFDDLGDLPELSRIRPAQFLCDTALPGRCVTELDGQIMYSDDNHPSVALAQLIVRDVLARFDAASRSGTEQR